MRVHRCRVLCIVIVVIAVVQQEITTQSEFGCRYFGGGLPEFRSHFLRVSDPPHRFAEMSARPVGIASGADYQVKYADETADELAFYPRVTMQVRLVAHVRIAQSERCTNAQYDEADRGIDRNGRQELNGDDLGRVPHIADERYRADRGDEQGRSMHEITQFFVRNAQQGNADAGKRERAVR